MVRVLFYLVSRETPKLIGEKRQKQKKLTQVACWILTRAAERNLGDAVYERQLK